MSLWFSKNMVFSTMARHNGRLWECRAKDRVYTLRGIDGPVGIEMSHIACFS